MKRVTLSIVMAGLLWVSVCIVIAQTKKVTRTVGPPLIGTVTARGDTYEVVTRTGPITVPASEVVSIVDYVTFEEEYSRRVLALEPGDTEGRYRLAQWCMGQKELTHARNELRGILKLKPDHENARLLLAMVEEELAAARKPRRSGPTTAGRRMIPGTKIPMSALVSKEDIMRVRLAELRSWDRVSVAFRDRADVRYADQMKGVGKFADPAYRRIFLTKPPVARAVEILVERPDAVELHRDILVRTNPRFMSTFKTRIWPMIVNHCAAPQCHGGVKGQGRLKLYNVRSIDDTVFFTNFLILDAFGNNRGRIVDRAHIPRSLLLQFGLPRDEARTTHTKEIRAMFRGVDDPRYRLVEAWIRDLMPQHPKYDIKYRVGGRRAPPAIRPVAPPAAGQPTPPAQPAQPTPGGGQ